VVLHFTLISIKGLFKKGEMDRKIEKKKWPAKRIALYAIGATAIIIALTALYREAGTSRLNVSKDRLLTDTVEVGVFKEYITLFGTVEPIKTVYLDAVESGRIEEIMVESGAMVQQGQTIMRLSNPDLELNVLNQEAQIITQINTIRNTSILMDQQSLSLKEQALDVQFRLDLLSKQAQRNQSLYSDQVISQVEFEETADEYEHLKRRKKLLQQTIEKDSLFQIMQENQMSSSLDLMQRNLDISKKSLEHLMVKAPISGQLSGLDSEIGELINRGDRIAQIDVQDEFKIRARINEHYISRVFPDQIATFTMDGKTYRLKIRRIYPEVTEGNFETDLVFIDGQHPPNIKRGQTISIRLSLSDETQATLLAKGGFHQTTNGKWVYVLNPAKGTARKRTIRIGRQNPNFYEVQSGLEPGDIVITSSYDTFGDKEELVLN
jgi:HlyD family secretion protein